MHIHRRSNEDDEFCGECYLPICGNVCLSKTDSAYGKGCTLTKDHPGDHIHEHSGKTWFNDYDDVEYITFLEDYYANYYDPELEDYNDPNYH